MMQSTNGGTSFNFVNDSYVDHHAMAFSLSNPNYAVIGNDGGIDYSTNGGAIWNSSTTLPISQFYAGEINPGNPEDILGGTQDNSTIRTIDGSLNNWQVIYGGDGFYCLVDYQNQNKIYASSQYGGLGRSTDGGNTFLSATSGLDLSYTNWMTPFVMDKNNPATLYCGTYKIHRSTNGMQSWTPISPDLANGHIVNLGTITTVDVSKSNPNVIYCGTDDANVWVTTNGGTDWTKINNGLPDRWVTRVTIHPDSANVCYVTLSGYKIDEAGAHIFRTSNFGNTWIPINGNLPDAPINDVIIDPLDYNSLYIATDDGVFFTTNLGASWGILADGIPATVPCHDLTLDTATRKLVVWTHGRSAYKLILPDPPVPVELSSFTAEVISNGVKLDWITSSEINNNGFIIERRLFGYEFVEIGFVKGSGTSTEIIEYSFTDKNSLPGKYSYRLRQIDYNGSFEYSQIVDVELKDEIEFTLSQNYPNPFNPSTKISWQSPVGSWQTLKVYDILGNEVATLVNEEKPAGTYEVEFNVSQLSSGIYFYKLQAGDFIATKKMIVIK
ncbi:MAG: T9SS type A sorting domain-containing protein [Ignavibacteriales bacterium]|nr:T9SS type A sorting domain-containing protein [Ignavibacteriales bacterium]